MPNKKKKEGFLTSDTESFRTALYAKVQGIHSQRIMDRILLGIALVGAIGTILGGTIYILNLRLKPIEDNQKRMQEEMKEFKKACAPIKTEGELAYMMRVISREECREYHSKP